MHVARHAGNVQRLAAAVAFDQADHFGLRLAGVHQAPNTQAGLQAQRDFGLHVGQFFLDQLGCGQRAAELLAVQRVLARTHPAVLGGTQRTPGDAIACTVQAAERALEPLHVRQQMIGRHEHVVHHDLAGDAGAQAHLALDLGRAQALHALFQDEAAYRTLALALAFQLGPDHENIGNRRIGDPHLRALEHIAAVDRRGARDHAARVGAVVGLGQAKAANPLAGREFGQVFLALGLAAVGVDRVHHQRTLHAHRAAVAAVDPLDLARHQAVADVVQAGAAVALDGAAQKAHGAEFVHDSAVECLVARCHQHPGLQFFLAEGVGRVDDGALVLAQLIGEQEGVLPVEALFHREVS